MERKKNEKYDLEQKSPLFFSIGLIVALLCVTAAFEWRAPYDKVDLRAKEQIWEPPIDIMITKFPEPEPPKPEKAREPKSEKKSVQITKIIEATHDLPKSLKPVDLDKTTIPEIEIDDPPIEKVPAGPFIKVESMPEFPGGEDAFYEYLSKNLKFPRKASQLNYGGKVTLSFIVDEQGKITEVTVLQGIGMGCDEEAIRVLENSPKWKPGKQRGRPVKVRMSMPINFTVAN